MFVGSAGQIALNAVLPRQLRDLNRVWNKKTVEDVLTQVAKQNPDKYKDIAVELIELSKIGMAYSGGFPFGVLDLLPSRYKDKYKKEIDELAVRYLDNKVPDMQDEELAEKFAEINSKYFDLVLDELKKEQNPVYKLVEGGIRGNPTILKRLKFAEGTYPDTWGRYIPYPIFNNFSEGLEPAEYWAAGYGSKQGIVTTKLAPRDAGDFYKQMMRVTHRLIVLTKDGPEVGEYRGMPVDANDPDNIGAVLAAPVAGLRAGTLITPEILDKLRSKKIKKILVKSPIAGGPPDGIYGVAAGARDGSFPAPGTLVGLEAAQAIGERVSQMSVGKKHLGAISKGIGTATDVLKQLISVPKNYGGATHSEEEGKIEKIEPAPAGGKYVYINGKKFYVGSQEQLLHKVGDYVEAGDVLSTGLPNPAMFVKYKGVGEGRRLFTELFLKTFRELGMPAHRRNTELLARGLINLVVFNRKYNGYYTGDIVQYNALEHGWKPRLGTKTLPVKSARDYYLEVPVLHYTIGTKITPSVIKTLQEYNIDRIAVNPDPPPFDGILIRALDVLSYDPDWLTRFLGAYQKRNLQEAAMLGGVSEKYKTTSFVPSLAEGTYFGTKWPQAILR